MIKKRSGLSEQDWLEKSQALCDKINNNSLFQKARTILAYFPIRQEPDLTYLFSKSKIWGFPRCVKNSLIWHSWQPEDSLINGKYGIPEPSKKAPLISPETVDLILIPALACDYNGYRLGYGGGFYDRLLNSPQWSHIPTVGIIFNLSLVSELPYEYWDQKLKAICTEKQFISINTQ